jgi:hypothetical protein
MDVLLNDAVDAGAPDGRVLARIAEYNSTDPPTTGRLTGGLTGGLTGRR